jgi:hypothetical protein
MIKEKTKEFKQKHITIIFGIIILGLLCILAATRVKSVTISNYASNIGSILLISGIYNLIDSYFLKRDLIDLVIEKVRLDKKVDDTGLVEIGNNLSEINYKDYFCNAKENIDILHIYGRTWTSNNLDFIKNRILDGKCRLRVIIMNPESKFIPALEEHFNYNKGELEKYINEATKTWERCYKDISEKREYFTYRSKRKKNKKHYKTNQYGSLELYYYNGQPTNSLYRIDDKIIVVETKTSKEKSTNMPYMIFKKNNYDNNLYAVYLAEIERVIKESNRIELNSEGGIINGISNEGEK